ncbi:Dephospho-CoA kinase [Candidatus Magnetaquicoccaceae bacterium FCR-1]|uniref:Dephospho-CoA kinase n=1 Tax=Candidatus Magnetaquiglobus chichijimensis TaxID=3141448 RepID=A0ABQ0CCC2_9PROT
MLYLLGITGSIGCGKSTVTRLLGEQGALTLDADQLARQALAPGSPLLDRVAERFGADLLTPDRILNRPLLAERVFSDPDQRRALEGLIHPHVFASMATSLERWDAQTAPGQCRIVALEIPLLFETGSESLCDSIAVVICGDRQTERLAERTNLTTTTRQNIIAQQLPETIKQQHADWILDNRCDAETLLSQILNLWKRLTGQFPSQNPAWPGQWNAYRLQNHTVFDGS